MDCKPSLKGEIKKARHSQYDFITCIMEFIDNAFDIKATDIQIEIKEKIDNYSRKVIKILISDNYPLGISKDKLLHIFSWTFERDRLINDIGEFGTGFKCASVNLGNTLRILTMDHNFNYWEAIADWESMMDKDQWSPIIQSISKEYYESYHPFQSGKRSHL